MEFQFEKLEVYQYSVRYVSEIEPILERIGSKHRDLRSQLRRASYSIVLNIAEGAGKVTAKDQRNFYAIARGSATECAATLHLLETVGAISIDTTRSPRRLLLSIVRMLSKMCLSPNK
ncbi:MAG: four helix bundle protein [Desulfobulbia bacterium]